MATGDVLYSATVPVSADRLTILVYSQRFERYATEAGWRLCGIGRATAVALAAMGADVVVTGTGRDPATFPEDEQRQGWRDVKSTAEQVRAHGRRALTWVGDVSQAAEVQHLVERIMQTFGRIDVLVNNAAYPRGRDRVPVPDLDEAVWHQVLEIKLTGSFLLCKRIVPLLIQQRWGRIINLSSVFGKYGGADTVAYCTANFGIQGFTQALALEVARHGITVNAVVPGDGGHRAHGRARPGRELAADRREHPHGASGLR